MRNRQAAPDAMPGKLKSFVLVRQDLTLAQQLVQACHAAMGAGFEFTSGEHPHLVLLGVPDKLSLDSWNAVLDRLEVPRHLFFEPDDGVGNSALATAPLPRRHWKHFRDLPLWAPPAAG